ncbi:MerR family transcriptional regulator [Brevibacillus reuszeri]|uniref:MerR family transcriptional regulator n=1 Tax=Brevibacillus reuszeri TaxID=54915 RepID=UPI003D1EAA68
MKSEITISELAKLMNVSVHQIRYFEEKGVLLPAYVDNNQYRMYSMDQVYQLAHILLLRRLGVSVQSIKECMTSFSADQYEQLLKRSLVEINDELLRLQELQQFINKILYEQQNFTVHPYHYQIKWRAESYLARWLEMDAQTQLHAKLLADRAKYIPNLFESDIYFIENETSTITLYTETQAPGDYSIPSGNYLTTQKLVQDDAELAQAIEQFYAYAATQSYVLQGPVILIERSYLSLFSQNELHYELQALIEPTPNSERDRCRLNGITAST